MTTDSVLKSGNRPSVGKKPPFAVSRWGQILAVSMAFCFLAFQTTDAAEAFRQLKGKEIKATFTGKDFTDDVHWAYAFGRDGKVTSYEMGRKTAGSWRINENLLCMVLGDEEPCYAVWISDTAVQLRDPDEREWTLEGLLQKPSKRF